MLKLYRWRVFLTRNVFVRINPDRMTAYPVATSASQELIAVSTLNITHAARQVDQARSAIHQIVESIQQVLATIEEIATATERQSSGLEQVSAAVTEMDRSTQDNVVLVGQTAVWTVKDC